MRLLLTRPRTDDTGLETTLAEHRHEVVHDPLLSIEPLPFQPVDISSLQAIVATSSNALRSLPAGLPLTALPIFAVGAATARLARAYGFTTVIAGDAGARDLTGRLVAASAPDAGGVLYLRGEDIAFDVEAALISAGLRAVSRIVYRTVPADQLSPEAVDGIGGGSIHGIVLLSPRTAETYVQLGLRAGLRAQLSGLIHFCLSGPVAARLATLGSNRIQVPARPDMQELVALIDLNATHSQPPA